MSACMACGGELPPAARFCPACGLAVAPPPLAPPQAAWQYGAEHYGPSPAFVAPAAPYAAHSQAAAVPEPSAGVPAIGLAGFILALLGVFTAGVTSLVGLPLSWVGYRQAKREGLPEGLCVAGIIINILGLTVLIGVIVLVLVGLALFPEATPNSYTY